MTATGKSTAEENQGQRSPDKDWHRRLDSELADSFPASDPPSICQPGFRPGGPQRNRCSVKEPRDRTIKAPRKTA